MDRRPADLHIASLSLELPASLGARKHSIVRLLRAELSRLEWPGGDLPEVAVPPLMLPCQQTNLAIAQALAQALLASVNDRLNRPVTKGGAL
ncbi:MAG: hypothetical protein WA987_07375 [Cellvibrio sp.]|jgi:hypothetical protein